MRNLLLLGCLALLAAPGRASDQAAAEQIRWLHRLPEATAQAAAGNKLIVTFLYADWCGWCRRMDQETWSDLSVIETSRQHVFLRLNAENEPDGVELRERFFVRGFPLVLLLNADGTEFDRLEGFMPAEAFLRRLSFAIADPDSLGNLKAAEAKNPKDNRLRMRLGSKLFGRMEYGEAQKRFEAVVRTDPRGQGGHTDAALYYLALSQAMQANSGNALLHLERLQQDFPGSEFAPRSMMLSGEILLQVGRIEEGRRRIEEFLRGHPDHPLAGRARRLLSPK